MPVVSRFFGIVITMYYNDHPPPHFHVRYGALIQGSATLYFSRRTQGRGRQFH